MNVMATGARRRGSLNPNAVAMSAGAGRPDMSAIADAASIEDART